MRNIEYNELNYLSHLISVGFLCTKESLEVPTTMMDIMGKIEIPKGNFLRTIGNPNFQLDITHS